MARERRRFTAEFSSFKGTWLSLVRVRWRRWAGTDLAAKRPVGPDCRSGAISSFVPILLLLFLAACSVPASIGGRATTIADSLLTVGRGVAESGQVCGETAAQRVGRVSAFAARHLEEMGFKCAVRTVRRVVQSPVSLRIDEIDEVVAWTRPPGSEDALFVAASHGFSAGNALDSTSVHPLAATLAAVERLLATVDSVDRSIVVTVTDVADWDVVDASSPRDSAASPDAPYRNELEFRADSGPSPPVVRPRGPGVVVGLLPSSSLPVLSHDPRSDLMTNGSVFGHEGWNLPASLSVDAYGDLLAFRALESGSVADDLALSDLAEGLVNAMKSMDRPRQLGNYGSGRVLRLDRQTTFWMAGVVLPLAFLYFTARALLVWNLTKRWNVERALRRTDATLLSHLLQGKRLAIREHRECRRLERRINRIEAQLDSRRAGRYSKTGTSEVGPGSRIQRLERRSEATRKALETAQHKREVARSRVHYAQQAQELAEKTCKLVGRSWLTRFRSWLVSVLDRSHSPETTTTESPSSEIPAHIAEAQKNLVCLGYHWQECEREYEEQKRDGSAIVGGSWSAVWRGVWDSTTERPGALAFLAGIGSVVAAVAVLPDQPWWLQPVVVVVVYALTSGSGHGMQMAWGAVTVTMLSLNSIAMTALGPTVGQIFDSQRIMPMLLVTVVLLLVGRAFSDRQPNKKNGAGGGTVLSDATAGDDLGSEVERKCRVSLDCLLKAANVKNRNPRRREYWAVCGVIICYVFCCAHFVAPAWGWPLGSRLQGDAIAIVCVTLSVLLLPILVLIRAKRRKSPEAGRQNLASSTVRCRTCRVTTQKVTLALACISVASACVTPGEEEPASVAVEERVGTTTYGDSVLMSGADSTTVAVRLKSESEGMVLSVERYVPGRLVAVDDLEVMAPGELVRVERWRNRGNLRPLDLLLKLDRCHAVRFASVELARDEDRGTWIRYSSELRQTRSLPNCCESKLRGSRSEG